MRDLQRLFSDYKVSLRCLTAASIKGKSFISSRSIDGATRGLSSAVLLPPGEKTRVRFELCIMQAPPALTSSACAVRCAGLTCSCCSRWIRSGGKRQPRSTPRPLCTCSAKPRTDVRNAATRPLFVVSASRIRSGPPYPPARLCPALTCGMVVPAETRSRAETCAAACCSSSDPRATPSLSELCAPPLPALRLSL